MQEYVGPGREKTCLQGVPTAKAQTSLSVSVFVRLYLILPQVKFSIIKLVSVAKETGLSLTLSETPNVMRPS